MMRHIKIQENVAHTEELEVETTIKDLKMINLVDKEIKSTILNIFKELKETISFLKRKAKGK